MKILIPLLLISAAAMAQTLSQRADKIVGDASQAKNAMQRVIAETKRLNANIAPLTSLVAPAVVVILPVVDEPHHSSLLPFIDVAKIPAPAVGFSTVRIKPETFDVPKQNTNGTGQFRMSCEFSHMGFNDPIVYPNQQGVSHLHTFFGNTAVDHTSTRTSIETKGNSTCAGGTANRTGYWVPTVIDTKDGTPLKPSRIMVYYKSNFLPDTKVKAYPAGLRMITGDMKSTGPQDWIYWSCIRPDFSEQKRSTSIPANCAAGNSIEVTISFPECWDGVNLDSVDHKSHMAFTRWDGVNQKTFCPSSHPVQVPHLTQKLYYNIVETGATARWRLSSDNYGAEKLGGYSMHADWFNGWKPEVQDIWIKSCLQANRDCHGFLLGDGTAVF